jgi:hypothetical protein
MVMLFKALSRERKGQFRILEAVIAAVIIFMIFSVSTFLIRVSDVGALQEKADLDRLGYNVLHKLVESGTIETYGEVHLKTAVQKSLPYTIYFNLTIYNCLDEAYGIQLQPFINVSNTSPDFFTNSLEVSSTSMIYTSKNGCIYYFVLVLARAGSI